MQRKQKTILYTILFSALLCRNPQGTNEQTETCRLLKEAEGKLNADQLKDLQNSGFAQIDGGVLISERVSPNCDLRFYTGKYIYAKMNNADAQLMNSYISSHKCEVSQVALDATTVNIWDGAGRFEKWNVVSEELMPCWEKVATEAMLSRDFVVIELFTRSMISKPSKILLSLAEKELSKQSTLLEDAAILLFLRRNAGLPTKSYQLTSYKGGELVRSKSEVISEIKRLLKKSKKITLSEIWEFRGEDFPD